MNWHFNANQPIYAQLIDQMTQAILSGAFPPGAQLPTVRDLAADAGVNPNTVQRALSEMERSGILFSQRTNGRYVTTDTTLLYALRKKLAGKKTHEYLQSLLHLGLTKEEIFSLIEEYEGGSV